MNSLSNKKIFLSFIVGAAFLPYLTSAATLHFDTKQKDFFVGDNIIVNVLLDSEGKDINAIDGRLVFDYKTKNISVGDLSVAGSAFSLWPQKPSLSMNEKEIYFTGGIPEGVNDDNLLVFKIILNLDKPGTLSFKNLDLGIYLNDGKGTKIVPTVKDMDIEILPAPEGYQSRREWPTVLEGDTNPPEPFEILLGQEGSVFDGKKFISFNTVDNESGVSYYEVIENNLAPVRSGNTYALQEQDKVSEIIVRAYDFAGNSRESIYKNVPTKPYNKIYFVLAIFILLILVTYKVRRMRKIKNEVI